MDKRKVIENLKKSLLILKDRKNDALTDKTLRDLSKSIEEAVRILDDGETLDRMSNASVSKDEGPSKDETIDSLGLSPRSSNALKRAGYMNIKDLRGIRLKKLKDIKGLGDKGVSEIIEKAKESGVKIYS